jgi:hypothetical protein
MPLRSFFGAGDSATPGKEVAAGFKKLVKGALQIILGSSAAGEHEEQVRSSPWSSDVHPSKARTESLCLLSAQRHRQDRCPLLALQL